MKKYNLCLKGNDYGYSICYDKKGIEAYDLLKKYNISDDEFRYYRNIIVDIPFGIIRNIPFLVLLFKNSNTENIIFKEGELNFLCNVKEAYRHRANIYGTTPSLIDNANALSIKLINKKLENAIEIDKNCIYVDDFIINNEHLFESWFYNFKYTVNNGLDYYEYENVINMIKNNYIYINDSNYRIEDELKRFKEYLLSLVINNNNLEKICEQFKLPRNEETFYYAKRNFNGYNLITFKVVDNTPYIGFSDGTTYEGEEDLIDFEKNVFNKYSKSKRSSQYRLYMAMADILRLECNMPPRIIGM